MHRRAFIKGIAAGVVAPYVLRPASAHFSHGDPCPPQMRAAGLTKIIFDVNFKNLNDFDINNTRLPGYKLYLNNGYPQANATFANTITNAFAAAPPTQPGDVSLRSGGGVILATDRTGLASGFQTACWDGSQFVGKFFTAPFGVEIGMAFDPSLGPAHTGGLGNWPAAWFWQKRGLDNSATHLTDVQSEDGNWEFIGSFPAGTGAANSGVSVNFSASQYTMDYPNAPQGTTSWQDNDDSMFRPGQYSFLADHVYSTVFASLTATTGTIRRYVDNVETLRSLVTNDDSADMVVTNYSGNGNQAFGFVGQSRSFWTLPTMGILGTGGSWPCTFFKYRFWGP